MEQSSYITLSTIAFVVSLQAQSISSRVCVQNGRPNFSFRITHIRLQPKWCVFGWNTGDFVDSNNTRLFRRSRRIQIRRFVLLENVFFFFFANTIYCVHFISAKRLRVLCRQTFRLTGFPDGNCFFIFSVDSYPGRFPRFPKVYSV